MLLAALPALALCLIGSTTTAHAAPTINTVSFGPVRITVHTPSLLRLEFSANGTFDDRPTLAFVNRGLGPPPFSHTVSDDGTRLSLNTSTLTLTYTGNASFGAANLAITFTLTPGIRSTWSPRGPGTVECGTVAGQDRQDCGVANPNATTCAAVGCCFDPNVNGTNYDQHVTHCYRRTVGGIHNLLGSVSTMDCSGGSTDCIAWYRTQLNQGLVSCDGWVVIDDSANPALNSSAFDGGGIPWRVERPWSAAYQDWYFFGHGHDYKQAVADFSALSGPINLMDVGAYGVWHSQYHAYSDADYRDVIAGYKGFALPLNVAVLDMDWHVEPPNTPGCDPYGGYVWNTALFPDPANFTAFLKAEGLRSIVNTHDVTGVDHCQVGVYEAMARASGVDPATNASVPCRLQDAEYTARLYELVLDPLTAAVGGRSDGGSSGGGRSGGSRSGGRSGDSGGSGGSVSAIDWFWTDWGKDNGVWYRCVDDTLAQPMLWSNYVHCQRARAAGLRGLVLSPYGGLGNHRYPQVGSGDTAVGFDTLEFEVREW